MEEKKEVAERKARTIPANPVDQLELTAKLMGVKAEDYGKGNMSRFVQKCGQSIMVNVEDIRAATKDIDAAILGQEKEIERLVEGNRKLTDELHAIKSSRLWRIYRRLIGHDAE